MGRWQNPSPYLVVAIKRFPMALRPMDLILSSRYRAVPSAPQGAAKGYQAALRRFSQLESGNQTLADGFPAMAFFQIL